MSANRKKIKKLEVMVADVIQETPDTTTLILFTGNDLLDYKPGHFVTIDPHQFVALERWTAYLEFKKGKKELPRAYSLSSSPDEKYLAITVKEEMYFPGKSKYPPLLSPILSMRTRKGSKMVITGFTGPYTLPKDGNMPKEILHICAGSGVVPNFSILKYTLKNYPEIKHHFMYSNQSWENTIFGKELIDLQMDFPNQLTVDFLFTRKAPEDFQVPFQTGRISTEMIENIFNKMEQAQIYICGPGVSKYEKIAARKEGVTPAPEFLESVLQSLNDLGIDKSQITHESYG
jgi:ferredoxin-NADP reductase